MESYHKLFATQQTQPSPQRVPALFQAGSSKPGINLAGQNAEGIFCGSLTPSRTKIYIQDVRAAARAAGREDNSVKVFPGMSTFIGRILEEAQMKYDLARSFASAEAGLAKLSGYTGIDLSKYPIDEPFDLGGEGSGGNAIHGFLQAFSAGDGDNKHGHLEDLVRKCPWDRCIQWSLARLRW